MYSRVQKLPIGPWRLLHRLRAVATSRTSDFTATLFHSFITAQPDNFTVRSVLAYQWAGWVPGTGPCVLPHPYPDAFPNRATSQVICWVYSLALPPTEDLVPDRCFGLVVLSGPRSSLAWWPLLHYFESPGHRSICFPKRDVHHRRPTFWSYRSISWIAPSQWLAPISGETVLFLSRTQWLFLCSIKKYLFSSAWVGNEPEKYPKMGAI